MDEQFIKVLYTALGELGVQSKEQFEQALQALGEDGVSLIYQQYQKDPQDVKSIASLSAQIIQQKQQTKMARMGAQLNYVNFLRGKCPEGYEVEKFLDGGCVKCQKKSEGGVAAIQKINKRFTNDNINTLLNIKDKKQRSNDLDKTPSPKKDIKPNWFHEKDKTQPKKYSEPFAEPSKEEKERRKMMAKKGKALKCENGGDLAIPQHVIDLNQKQKILKSMPRSRSVEPAGFAGYAVPVGPSTEPLGPKGIKRFKKEVGPQPEDTNGYRIIPIPNPNEYRVMPIPNYVPVNPEYVPIYTI